MRGVGEGRSWVHEYVGTYLVQGRRVVVSELRYVRGCY